MENKKMDCWDFVFSFVKNPYKASPIPITTQADPKYKPITSNSDPGGRYRTTTLIANANGIP